MAGKTLTFQVSAEHDDVWDENLRFSLIDNEVPFYRASIDPVTGEFTCRPLEVSWRRNHDVHRVCIGRRGNSE